MRKEVNRPVVHVAEDKRAGMTFGEMLDFVEDAKRAGVPQDQRIKMVATFRQTIQELSAKGPA